MNKKFLKVTAILLVLIMVMPLQAFAADSTTVDDIQFDAYIAPGTVTMTALDGAPEPEPASYTGETEGAFKVELPRFDNYEYTITQDGSDPGVVYDKTVYTLKIFWGRADTPGTKEDRPGLQYYLYVDGDPNKYAAAHFTNTKVGDLTIHNIIEGSPDVASTDENGEMIKGADGEVIKEPVEFTYTIIFTKTTTNAENNPYVDSYFEHDDGSYVVAEDGTKVPLTVVKNADGSVTYTGSFTMKHDDSITFPKLPEGTGYDVFVDTTEQRGYDVDSVVGTGALMGSGARTTINGDKDDPKNPTGWFDGEIQGGVHDDIAFTIAGTYDITLKQANIMVPSEDRGDWDQRDDQEGLQNFSYLSYVAQGQNLTSTAKDLRVAVVVNTDTQGDSTRYLNVEQVDGEYVSNFFQKFTVNEGMSEPDVATTYAYAVAAIAGGYERGYNNDGVALDWNYYPATHTIVFDAETVQPGQYTKEHVIRTSVPAVNSETTFEATATLMPDDEDRDLATSDSVRATAYAEWLRIVTWVGNLNEPEDWQKDRTIDFTVTLSELSAQTQEMVGADGKLRVHYHKFLSPDDYGMTDLNGVEREALELVLTPNGDGSYTGTVTLQHGQRVSFYDIHEGDDYTVAPDLSKQQNERYAVYKAGEEGEIGKGWKGDAIDMAVFRLIPVHDLTVTKETVGVPDAANTEFIFDIELDVRDTFDDIYRTELYLDLSTVNFDDIDGEDDVFETSANTWTGTITLTGAGDGSSVTYTGVPDGSTFSLTEKADPSDYRAKITMTEQQTITHKGTDDDDTPIPYDPVVTKLDSDPEKVLFNKNNVTITYENTALYDLIYDLNGGNVDGDTSDVSTKHDNKDVVDVPKNGPAPSREGMAFGGWSTSKHEAGLTEKPDDIITEMDFTNEANWYDQTVYAVWAEDDNGNGIPDWDEAHYTLTYDPNGGKGDVPEKETHVTGVTATLAEKPVPTKEGAVWVGWSEVPYDKLFDSQEAVDKVLISEVLMNSDKTVYAVWAADANNNGIPDYLEGKATESPKPTDDSKSSSGRGKGPKTGDETQIGLWIAVLIVMILGLTTVCVITRKKKTSKNKNGRMK